MKKTILLADDDDSVRKMVARVLETAGYSVTQAATGPEAVAKSRAREPDLILLDLKLPEQEGWQVFEQISRFNPLLPVVVITAWPNQYEEAIRRGIDALMEKPLDLPVLLQTIRDLLAESDVDRTRRLTDRNFTTAYLAHAGS
ncbi:MAG TPA: response regulator [Candidatus Binatia bacterium]|jgi:CheY-like chemotaxis protein|nr:response regulator [Candidatus Binatia bacterium]